MTCSVIPRLESCEANSSRHGRGFRRASGERQRTRSLRSKGPSACVFSRMETSAACDGETREIFTECDNQPPDILLLTDVLVDDTR